MNILSPSAQRRVEETIVKEGLLTQTKLDALKIKAESAKQPILTLLVGEGHITDEQYTRVVAHVNKIPYVNLSEARINTKVLELLPQEIAEHYMAVPLGEMQEMLVVAMLDAGNVQAADFLSNKIGRPLKVYAASESGIRRVLKQYEHNIEHGVASMLAEAQEAEERLANN